MLDITSPHRHRVAGLCPPWRGPAARYVTRVFGLVVTAILVTIARAHAAPAGYEYVSPEPGSHLVSVRNNVVLREGSAIDAGTLDPGDVAVAGAVSGLHAGTLALSDDGATIVFAPDSAFRTLETVTVTLAGEIRTALGDALPPLEYSFVTSESEAAQPSGGSYVEWLPAGAPSAGRAAAPAAGAAPEAQRAGVATLANVLPPTFPRISVTSTLNPPPGAVFLTPFTALPADSGHLVIVDNYAQPLFYRRLATPAMDFKRQPNGWLTYFTPSPQGGGTPRFYALDSAYAIVDSFATGNGYLTDSHELQLLPDGHVLLLAYDPQHVAMDSVVAGGDPAALVTGAIVQELDRARRVVFQWRSWDHFAITDCVSPFVDLQGPVIDYVHANSIEPDGEALVLSSRHLDEITKIDRRTGAVLWRMGPYAVHNEFAFPNDARGFSHQHDARVLPNGHITLFDNGNGLLPAYSRAVEYALDETADGGRTATLVWEHRNVADVNSGFMGNVQRQADGGSMVGWGGAALLTKVTEVNAEGVKDLELAMLSGMWTYRAFRFPWRTSRIAAAESLVFGEAAVGDSVSRVLQVTNRSDSSVTLNDAYVSHKAFVLDTELPVTLAPGEAREFKLRFVPYAAGTIHGTLYLKSQDRNELIAQDIRLSGEAEAPALGAVVPRTPVALRLDPVVPNPARTRARVGFELPAPGRVVLEVFDVNGRRVAGLVDAVLPAGHHVRAWQPRRGASGTYFCRVRSGGATAVVKLVLAE